MTANPTVVNTNEFFCVPVGKSRQAAIFLGNLVKNAIEEGKRIPKRIEMSSDLGMCVRWIEDIGVPAIYAYSAYYSAKGRGMMKGEGQSMRVALEFISKVFGQLSADECMLGWREFCSKGKKIVSALNQLCGEATMLAKNPELLNVTKYCIEGADMLRSIANIWDLALGVAEDNDERSFKAAFHQNTAVGEVYKEFISDESSRASSSRRWRSYEEFQTTAEFERHDRRIAKYRDRNWGKVFTLSVIKAPKIDSYGRGSKDDYQKNWDLGLVYQNELRTSMKNLAYALRRDENASQNNLLRWMICGSTPSDISDACIGAVNSLMCVSFIMRRLQPLLGEKDSKDQSYTAYFRSDKRELNDLYREIEHARDCIDMIYESKLPAMNINSISLAPHTAAENQDRRKWVSWMKEIEKKAEKDVMIEFFQNKYCTIHEIERELEKYPEDFVVGEEPTWWVMGSSKTEPPRKTERQQKSASSSGQRSQTAGGSVPQPGAPSGGSQASDAVKIDNEIIDSIFRMNSGGDDDRWMIINPTAGHATYTSFEGGITLGGATVNVKFNIDNNTGYPILQTVFGPCLAEGKNATYWECMLRCLTSSLLHFEEKTSAEKIILSYVGKGNAAWLQLYAFLCAQTGCLFTGRLPGAKAINALIQAERNPDNAPGQLNRIIKRHELLLPVAQQDVVVGPLADEGLVVVEVLAGRPQAQVGVVVLPRAGQLPVRAREQRVGPRSAPQVQHDGTIRPRASPGAAVRGLRDLLSLSRRPTCHSFFTGPVFFGGPRILRICAGMAGELFTRFPDSFCTIFAWHDMILHGVALLDCAWHVPPKPQSFLSGCRAWRSLQAV